jgi:hypothetical protein
LLIFVIQMLACKRIKLMARPGLRQENCRSSIDLSDDLRGGIAALHR